MLMGRKEVVVVVRLEVAVEVVMVLIAWILLA